MAAAVLDQFIDQLASAVAEKLQANLQPEQSQQDSEVNFMNKGEVAAYLHTSRTTLDRWIANEGFPSSKIGGRYIYKREDVDRWVEAHTK